MKMISLIVLVVILTACGSKTSNTVSDVEYIQKHSEQIDLFNRLCSVFQLKNETATIQDSVSFLILPVQASCPSCRKKTIDSIMSNIERLPAKHYILIAANGGRKTIGGYFLEQQYKIPSQTKFFLLDSLNISFKLNLYEDKPTFYYTFNGKAYKKVAARPSSVREDLREFFSGYRLVKNKKASNS